MMHSPSDKHDLAAMQPDSWVGRTHRTRFRVDESIIGRFAELSGDENPIHVDQEEARAYGYPRQVAHGAVLVAFWGVRRLGLGNLI